MKLNIREEMNWFERKSKVKPQLIKSERDQLKTFSWKKKQKQ